MKDIKCPTCGMIAKKASTKHPHWYFCRNPTCNMVAFDIPKTLLVKEATK